MDKLNIKTLQTKIEHLPPEFQQEVIDFIDFLIYKYEQNQTSNKTKSFTFSWAGKLSNLKNKYSSVELQHSVM